MVVSARKGRRPGPGRLGWLRTAFPDDHPLAGVQIKKEGARGHLEELNGGLADFLSCKPHQIAEERKRGGRALVPFSSTPEQI